MSVKYEEWKTLSIHVTRYISGKSSSCYCSFYSQITFFLHFVGGTYSIYPLQSPHHPSTDVWASLLVQKDYYSNVKMELMVCQMLFAQLSEKTSLKSSHVLLFGHFSETLQNCPIMFYYGKANPVNQCSSVCPCLQRQSTWDLMAFRSLHCSKVIMLLRLMKFIFLYIQ